MNKRIVITGLGVISSIGIGWEEFWESLLNGKSGINSVTSIDTDEQFTHNGGEVKHFNPLQFIAEDRVNQYNRSSQFAVAAAQLAREDAGLSIETLPQQRTGICIGTTTGSIQAIERINDKRLKNEEIEHDLIYQLPPHSTPAAIAKELAISGPNCMISTACAAGNYAIGYGFDLIRSGRADLVFAGGSDPFSRISFTGFNQFSAAAPEMCQPFDKNRKGMMVAEGAGIVVLESLDNALERNAPIYAEILGYGLSCDAQHMTQPSVEGVARCMRNAMREAGISEEQIDYISAHGTGTQANDKTESAAIKMVFGERFKSIPVSSIKSMLGHTMGAASAIEAIACALAITHDIIPPTINFETPDPECDLDCVPNKARHRRVTIAMNNSYAFGGNNASLIMKKFITDKETKIPCILHLNKR